MNTPDHVVQTPAPVAQIDYYKPNGKWYTEATLPLEANEMKADGGTYYLFGRVAQLVALNTNLPGLKSGTWEGCIVVRSPISGLSQLFVLPERLVEP